MIYLQEQDECFGDRAETLGIHVVHTYGLTFTGYEPVEKDTSGLVRKEVVLGKSEQGSEIVAVLTLNNSAGQTQSEMKKMCEFDKKLYKV